MPTFFSFQQGSEDQYHNQDASPLLGRFRAVPRQPSGSGRALTRGHLGLLSASSAGGGAAAGDRTGLGTRGSGYGAIRSTASRGRTGPGGLGLGLGDDEDDEDESSDSEAENEEYYKAEGGLPLLGWRLRRLWKTIDNTWVTPTPRAVRKVARRWWKLWFVLVMLPAALAVGWCAMPFPQYPIPTQDDPGPNHDDDKAPGHGNAHVRLNFWFFLFFYYGFYNLTALIWITKVFNIYSLNWWPQSLGFPLTVCAIAVVSLAGPIPIYLLPETKFLTVHNTAWISWTFIIMAMPVTIAFCILMTNERHLSLRHSLSETQRIFTSSWWAGEPEHTLSARRDADRSRHRNRRRATAAFDDPTFDAALQVGGLDERLLATPVSLPVGMRRRWLPASFVRFVWFCLALFIGLMAYVIGEAYAEIYLLTLPHNNLETIVYVYGWISTVYLLDGLTGWILGGNEGERVGSYPLSWTFKLYFALTYQTYVRALYARLRSPSQFILLQILSSSGLIIVTPLLMSGPVHWFLTLVGMNDMTYPAYQKMCARNVFIRFLAENVSMLAFLASVCVLHFGANKDVYPYFAFDGREGDDGGYTFDLTFRASGITWACELVASGVVAGLIRCFFGVSVVEEGSLDLVAWPELLPTSVAVMLHVLQNMFFSIIRLQFK